MEGHKLEQQHRKSRDRERHRDVQGEIETYSSQEDAPGAWAVQGKNKAGKAEAFVCMYQERMRATS